MAGSQASLTVDGFALPPSENESSFWIRKRPGMQESHEIGPCIQEAAMIERFSRIARSKELDPRLPQDALNTVRVCCALATSAKTGEVAEVE